MPPDKYAAASASSARCDIPGPVTASRGRMFGLHAHTDSLRFFSRNRINERSLAGRTGLYSK